MKLEYEIYIRIGKEEEPVSIESVPLEKRKQLGDEINDTFLKAAGYTPVKTV